MLPDIVGPDHYSSVLRLFAMTDSANSIKRRIASEREGLRSFAADAHDCIIVQVLESGLPLISSRAPSGAILLKAVKVPAWLGSPSLILPSQSQADAGGFISLDKDYSGLFECRLNTH